MKFPILRRAAEKFVENADSARTVRVPCVLSAESTWLDDYALFMAIKMRCDAQARLKGSNIPSGSLLERDIAARHPQAIVDGRNCVAMSHHSKDLAILLFRAVAEPTSLCERSGHPDHR